MPQDELIFANYKQKELLEGGKFPSSNSTADVIDSQLICITLIWL